jgi:hypothetical protein
MSFITTTQLGSNVVSVVIEGIDNSGKSTLAKYIAQHHLCPNIVESEGPPRYPGEINERISRYFRDQRPNLIYVRHPVVSQPIYNLGRMGKASVSSDEVSPTLMEEFYRRKPTLIYCDPGLRGLEGHQVKAGEDEDHLASISRNYNYLLLEYRRWALRHAHVIYRIGDDMERVAQFVYSTWRSGTPSGAIGIYPSHGS